MTAKPGFDEGILIAHERSIEEHGAKIEAHEHKLDDHDLAIAAMQSIQRNGINDALTVNAAAEIVRAFSENRSELQMANAQMVASVKGIVAEAFATRDVSKAQAQDARSWVFIGGILAVTVLFSVGLIAKVDVSSLTILSGIIFAAVWKAADILGKKNAVKAQATSNSGRPGPSSGGTSMPPPIDRNGR